ncbi:MAG: DNA polymerase III subunit delta [Candidatus Pelagibacterales bacterium]|nr:MAG: DNA polymerase III subunit delta [Pelagibacterales bacterium]
MIVKSYEAQKNKLNLSKYNFFLLYGENFGLKKDIRDIIKIAVKQKNDNLEVLSVYENEILDNEESFYNSIYSGSLFSNKKIITIFDATDKIIKKIDDIFDENTENVYLVIFSGILDKKSKLRNFFETNKKTICIPCYLDTSRDLEIIAQSEFRENNISVSREVINLLVEKANSDRSNLKNEIEKIKAYSLNKKELGLNEIKSLINFSGDYKSDILVNECLCGNVPQYKKIISELYINTVNQILLLRILSNKVQRLLNIKKQEDKSNNIDNLINNARPAIFWKDKELVKKQLSIWNLHELKKIISGINNTEYLCKKNPQASKVIFFNFFLKICTKANNFA